jgi:hypothetical protein
VAVALAVLIFGSGAAAYAMSFCLRYSLYHQSLFIMKEKSESYREDQYMSVGVMKD